MHTHDPDRKRKESKKAKKKVTIKSEIHRTGPFLMGATGNIIS